LQCAEKRTSSRVVSVNAGIALAEIANQQCAAENSETGCSECDTPRWVQSAIIDTKRQISNAIRIEPANEAVAHSFLVKPRHRINLRIGDIQRATNRLDVERVIGVSHRVWNCGIGKREAGCRLQGERVVEDVNRAVGEVGCVEEVAHAIVSERQAGVDVARMARCDDTDSRTGGRGVWIPTDDVAGNRRKEKIRAAGSAGTGSWKHELRRYVISDRTCRQAAGNGYSLRTSIEYDGTTTYVASDKLGRTGAIVRHPERTRGSQCDSPGID